MKTFDFLVDDDFKVPAKNWQTKAHYVKREAIDIDDMDVFIKRYGEPNNSKSKAKLEEKIRDNPLAFLRTLFLRDEFMCSGGNNNQAEFKARDVGKGWDLLQSNLLSAPREGNKILPKGSASLTLKFKLTTPLLTADDDAFYLFDNPLRKDHIFSVPYLSAAAIKGLSADAYCHAFPGKKQWSERGEGNATRLLNLYTEDAHAKRLFGLTNDENDIGCKGRLHFSPVWFQYVQYVVFNKMNTDNGTGTQPLHFEAVSPVDDKNQPVVYSLNVFYFNPVGTADSGEAIVKQDLARWLASVASWWPVLGLGAKRMAGYGAIQPVSVELNANNWIKKENTHTKEGKDSWLQMAQWMAGEKDA